MQNWRRRTGWFRKTALIEAITSLFFEIGFTGFVITNDIVTTEDAKHVRKMLKGYLAEERIIGVETGACPHTAVTGRPFDEYCRCRGNGN